MIKIIIADDHKMVNDGLRSLLANCTGMKVIASAANGLELLQKMSVVTPDIVLMDIDMPVMNGIEALSKISKLYPIVRVIVLTMHEEHALIKKMSDLGAKGFLFKNADKDELVSAIELVAEGNTWFSQTTHSLKPKSQQLEKETGLESAFLLTEREIEILKLIASGLSNKEIGDQLFISHRTVDTHRTNLMKKLNVNNIAGLIRFAIKNGYVQ